MSKTLANILRDSETNYLWLHCYTRDEDNFIHTPDGIVDVAAHLLSKYQQEILKRQD